MKHKKEPNRQQREANTMPFSDSPPIDSPASKNDPNRRLAKSGGWTWETTIQFCLLLVGVAYAGLTYRLWQTADETRRMDQRAWLSTSVDSPLPEVGKNMPIRLNIRNSGKTFALNARSCSLYSYTNDVPHKDPREVPSFSMCGEDDWTAPNLVPPGDTWSHEEYATNPKGRSVGLDAQQVEWLLTGKMILWTYGKIAYNDVFEKPHWVTYCYLRIVTDTGQAHFVTCNTGNDTDRNE